MVNYAKTSYLWFSSLSQNMLEESRQTETKRKHKPSFNRIHLPWDSSQGICFGRGFFVYASFMAFEI